jgi:DNA-binding response OmpR family regulator
MGSGSEKKQLGKIMLAQKLVSPDELQEMLDEQKRSPRARLASAAALRGRVSVADALHALSEQHGIGAVDLAEEVVPLALLRLVPVEMAQEHIVFPVRFEEDRLVLAMSSPDDKSVIEELEFVTGKVIVPLVTLDQSLRNVILHAYAAFARGEEYYVGSQVTRARLADMGLPDLPRAPDSMVPEAPAAEAAADSAPTEESAAEAIADAVAADDSSLKLSVPPTLDEAFGHRSPLSLSPPRLSVPSIESRVLLAVADIGLRAEVRQALNDGGLSVLEAADGAQALSLLESLPKIFVLEVELSSMHGLDVCRKLRADARHAQLPVIVIGTVASGWRYERDLKETLGVQHYFERPLDMAKLTQTVQLVLDGQPVVDELPPLRSDTEARWTTAMSAFERGDLETAIVELRASVQLEPGAFEPHYHLGLLHGRRDELFAALGELELALRAQPHSFLAMKNLAVIYQRVGFRYKALDAWQRAMVHAPDAETRANIKQHLTTLL